MLFDSHAHLDVPHFDEDRKELFKKIEESNVSFVVNPGVDLETSRNAIKLAQEYPWLYAAVGFYPQETRYMDDDMLVLIENLAKKDKVVAIGEIGLDYYWDRTPHDVQQYWFRKQLQLAIKLNLPVIIHDREAHGDIVQILYEEKVFENTKVLMHCYSGSASMAKELLKHGCYFSIAGPVTYGNNRKAKAVVEAIPLDHMCIETDSPYLTPLPFRGKRNDPTLVEHTARKIAELKGVSFEEVAEATCNTAKKIFGIK
ncbi:MAG: TatD family hydrolase [Firmicutes bacterium]|nr:TatD family hydrolase [Bacillota bacterium]